MISIATVSLKGSYPDGIGVYYDGGIRRPKILFATTVYGSLYVMAGTNTVVNASGNMFDQTAPIFLLEGLDERV